MNRPRREGGKGRRKTRDSALPSPRIPASGSALGPGAEFDRIRRIVTALGPAAGPIGDDCAVIPEGPGQLVVSTDLSVEGVHFRTEWLTLREIGWRAAASALSDLGAEGASTVGVLVSLGVPTQASAADPVELMAGVGEAVASTGGAVLGGDLSRADQWLGDVVVLRRAERPVTRAGARPGDGIWMSGSLGGARAALAAWRRGEDPPPAARESFAHPRPRLAVGRALAAAGASAMLDVSDGLGGDCGHLAAASACALDIQLDLLPLHPDVVAAANAARLAPAHFAALGGEDYELLAALPPSFGEEDAATLSRETGVPLTRIGTVNQGTGVSFHLGGVEVTLRGFDHFG